MTAQSVDGLHGLAKNHGTLHDELVAKDAVNMQGIPMKAYPPSDHAGKFYSTDKSPCCCMLQHRQE